MKNNKKNTKKTTKTTKTTKKSAVKRSETKQAPKKVAKTVQKNVTKVVSKKERIKAANELREISNKTEKRTVAIHNKREQELQGVKSPKTRERIYAKYQKKIDSAENVGNKAYKAYYDYVHKNFSSEEIVKAKPFGSFTTKHFINRLEKTAK